MPIASDLCMRVCAFERPNFIHDILASNRSQDLRHLFWGQVGINSSGIGGHISDVTSSGHILGCIYSKDNMSAGHILEGIFLMTCQRGISSDDDTSEGHIFWSHLGATFSLLFEICAGGHWVIADRYPLPFEKNTFSRKEILFYLT